MNAQFLNTMITKATNRAGAFCLSVCMVFFVFGTFHASAQGNLMILPKRVVLNGNKSTQEISLNNTGADTAVYDISVVNMSVSDSGRQEMISGDDTTQFFADKFVRIYPRRVKLWPNKTQTVKVQLVHAGLMKQCEYRSHLYLRAVPNVLPLGEKTTKPRDTASGITIGPLKAVFGITIPIILRVGTSSDLNVEMTDAKLIANENEKKLALTFSRTGSVSAYGELTANYISKDGVETQVGYAKGISIYTTNKKRYFELPLQTKDGVNYKEGRVHLVFRNQDKDKKEVLAETSIALMN